MPTTPSKAQQEAEANARAHGERLRGESPIPANETAAALDAPGDTPADPLEGAPAPQPAPAPEPQAERKLVQTPSIGDQKRAEIMGRFRTERPNLGEQDNDEVIAFTKSGGMPAEFRPIEQPEGETVTDPEPAAAAAAEPEPAPAPDPQMVEITVRGEKKLVPLTEALGKAQIAYAADNYLDEARNRLDSVKSLEQELRAQRPAQNGATHPAAPNGTQTAEPAPSPDDPSQHPESPIKRMIEAIQFGDPAEAEVIAQNTLGQLADAATEKALANQRLREDAAAARKVTKEFEDNHADIAKDRKSRAAIEADILDQQISDLQALNVDFNRIRQDGRPPLPADISSFHQLLRANGANVKSPAEMLETGLNNFLQWKGIKTPEPAADPDPPPAPPQQQLQRSPAPKVVVSVDRQQRRQQPAASPQPSQTQRPAPAPAPRPQDPLEARASVVEQMQQRKQLLRSGSPYVLGAVRRA